MRQFLGLDNCSCIVLATHIHELVEDEKNPAYYCYNIYARLLMI